MHRVIHGVVLRATDTKEADRILTVLSAEEGRLTVIARGVRRKNDALSAAAEIFTYSEMTVYERGGWTMLADASPAEHFFGVRGDIERLALASYFAELAEAVAPEGESAGELTPLFLNALYALGELKAGPDKVKAAFELRLMCVSGYAPLLDSCAACGETDMDGAMFDVMRGVARCADCPGEGGGLSMPLGREALAAMRYVCGCPAKKLYSFAADGEALGQMSGACEAFCAAQLERGFSTLDFYKRLRMKNE
jgi:DNA repair protein RecO (recombination protein O)